MLNSYSQWSHTYETSMKILDFQRHSANIRNKSCRLEKTTVVFLDSHKKNASNIHRIFTEQSGNITMFSIPGTFFWNIPRNFIGNIFRIHWKYLMGMFHEYSTDIHLLGGNFGNIVHKENICSFGNWTPKKWETTKNVPVQYDKLLNFLLLKVLKTKYTIKYRILSNEVSYQTIYMPS